MDIYQSKQLRLMIELIEKKVTIGTIDLYDIDVHNRRAGIGILIDQDHRQKGFGKQALELMSKYAFDFLYLHQIYAYIAKNNIYSIGLFEKSGYRLASILKDWVQRGDTFEDVCLFQLVNNK
jgi:diamine N-acetyltransferase